MEILTLKVGYFPGLDKLYLLIFTSIRSEYPDSAFAVIEALVPGSRKYGLHLDGQDLTCPPIIGP